MGLAKLKPINEPPHTPCYSLPYAAPEVLNLRKYDETSDMWSLGVILFTMLSRIPTLDSSTPDLATLIRTGDVDFNSDKMRRMISRHGRQLLAGLLTESNTRMTASMLAMHPWLSKGLNEAGSIGETRSSDIQR